MCCFFGFLFLPLLWLFDFCDAISSTLWCFPLHPYILHHRCSFPFPRLFLSNTNPILLITFDNCVLPNKPPKKPKQNESIPITRQYRTPMPIY